jgi:hypothetical protein
MKNNLDKSIDLIATRLAEIRLSELGYRYIPGVYRVIKRLRQLICARALIVRSQEIQI